MKKYLLAIGLVAFLMTSCCEKQENKETKECCKDKKEQCDKHHECDHQMPPMCPEMMAKFDMMTMALANWEDLDAEQRADAIAMAKEMVAKKEQCQKHEGCGKHEGKCEKHEGCGKHEGKCEKHEGKCEKHEGCGKHEGCKHEEGKKCEGNHEGCEHQHEGCQHDKK